MFAIKLQSTRCTFNNFFWCVRANAFNFSRSPSLNTICRCVNGFIVFAFDLTFTMFTPQSYAHDSCRFIFAEFLVFLSSFCIYMYLSLIFLNRFSRLSRTHYARLLINWMNALRVFFYLTVSCCVQFESRLLKSIGLCNSNER